MTYREAANNPSTKAAAAHAIAQGDVRSEQSDIRGMGRVIPKGQTEDAELFLDRKAAKESVTRKANANAIRRPKQVV